MDLNATELFIAVVRAGSLSAASLEARPSRLNPIGTLGRGAGRQAGLIPLDQWPPLAC